MNHDVHRKQEGLNRQGHQERQGQPPAPLGALKKECAKTKPNLGDLLTNIFDLLCSCAFFFHSGRLRRPAATHLRDLCDPVAILGALGVLGG